MSALRHLLHQAGEAFEVPRDLLLRRYPPFVTGGSLPRGDVPVFVFHSLVPEVFGRQLGYLADNGYETLSLTDYMGVLTGTRTAPERAVLLTFDDGRGSLWSVGQTLLRKHGMRGTVFLVPGRMASRPGPPAPTLDDVQAGRQTAELLAAREDGPGAFLSWEEVGVLSRSGVFEFQSHSLTHARVHCAPSLRGFVSPDLRRGGYAALDVPLLEQGGRDLFAEEAPLGAPLLQATSRLSDALRFHEDEAWRQRATRVVDGLGVGFFQQPDWRDELRLSLGSGPVPGRMETSAEQELAIRRELVEGRSVIEGHTGVAVEHLCYPWHVAGTTAQRLAREAGYRTAFWGKVKGVPLTRPSGDLANIARIGEDYVELLPGRGRTTLAAVLRHKWFRRFRGAGA